MEPPSKQILIAGAGIAGLTAALAFARHGYRVRLFEHAPKLEEAGAGLQISPNATRLLDGLGLAKSLRQLAGAPEAIVLRSGSDLSSLGEVPLGETACNRWGAPYLVAHRADLQRILVAALRRNAEVSLELGASVENAASRLGDVTLHVRRHGVLEEVRGGLLVIADGVWSQLRPLVTGRDEARFTGHVAWRTIVERDSAAGRAISDHIPGYSISAFLAPRFHLVAYPVRAGRSVNLVAITKGQTAGRSWSQRNDRQSPSVTRAAPALDRLIEQTGPWTRWPIYEVGRLPRWHDEAGMVLIGDAAHAMPPHAAQGAAMAIEDAIVLADLVAAHPTDLPAALAAYERQRRPRIERVRQRGRFNQFVWHAWGPVALGRDLVLRARSPERLAADLDWLYGWRPDAPSDEN